MIGGGRGERQAVDGNPILLTLSHPQSILDYLLDTLLSSLRALIVEDSHQMSTSLRQRHRLPTSASSWILLEGHLENRRQLLLALHGEQESFGDLLGAPLTRLGTLHAIDPTADLVTDCVAQPGKPLRQHLLAFEELGKLWLNGRRALVQVRRKGEVDHRTDLGTSGLLHLFVDQ